MNKGCFDLGSAFDGGWVAYDRVSVPSHAMLIMYSKLVTK